MPFRILCAMSHKMPIIFPMMSTTPSPAYPWAYTPCLLNHFSRLSATADHSAVGDKLPPCGNPCLVVTVMYVCSLLTHTVLFCIRVIIQFFTALFVFHLSNAVLIALHGVLSKVPSMSKKIPSASSFASNAFFILPTSWCNAFSVDFPAW